MLGMTKAIYNIKTTFREMVELHEKEVRNHQNLIEEFRSRAKEVENQQEILVYLLEAHRNREHQKDHEKMIEIYKYLQETL